MRKYQELTDPSSCLSRAGKREMLFVFLSRDKSAPVGIRAWIADRIESGKNQPDDALMINAEECARIMEAEQEMAAKNLLDSLDTANGQDS